MIACFLFGTPEGFGPWLSLNLCCAQCIRMVLLCSFHESELCVQLGLQKSGAHTRGAGLAPWCQCDSMGGKGRVTLLIAVRNRFYLETSLS